MNWLRIRSLQRDVATGVRGIGLVLLTVVSMVLGSGAMEPAAAQPASTPPVVALQTYGLLTTSAPA
jgi:hypothetical protein